MLLNSFHCEVRLPLVLHNLHPRQPFDAEYDGDLHNNNVHGISGELPIDSELSSNILAMFHSLIVLNDVRGISVHSFLGSLIKLWELIKVICPD